MTGLVGGWGRDGVDGRVGPRRSRGEAWAVTGLVRGWGCDGCW